MRSSRLLALLMELTRTPRTSVAALAEQFGVTSRTIQRDIVALHEMGVPVWTRTGPAGGVGLIEGWRSPLTGMTAAELQALVVGEAGARGLGMHADFETARLKMLTASPAQAGAVEPAHERFLLDNERWFAEPERPAALPEVARAVWAGRRISIRYGGPGRPGPPSARLVDPLGLVLKTDSWYLIAAHRGSPRTYRVSRILTVQVHEQEARRPDGFSLPEHWERSRAAFESSRYTLPVTLSFPESSLGALRAAVPGVDVESALAEATRTVPVEGRLVLDLLMENLEIAAAQLLAVDGVEVHEPAALRERLHARGEDLAARHRPGATQLRPDAAPIRPAPPGRAGR